MTLVATRPYINPVSDQQQLEIIAATNRFIALAAELFDRSFDEIPVDFDLKGRAAGMYVVSKRGFGLTRKIRYNPWLFAKYYRENLAETVPHEVAHYVVDMLYGRSVRPHGREWKSIMQSFGLQGRVTSDYNLAGIPLRTSSTVAYACNCREHKLGIRRHNKVLRGEARYHCRFCGSQVVPL